MQTSKIILSLTLATCLGACSTITTGTTQPLTVETPMAPGAACSLTDTKNGTWRVQQTPQTVEVRKGDGPMAISCSKSGYVTEKVVVQEQFAGATLGNVILGGGIGIIVDAASGAAQEYPDVVKVWMQPKTWKSSAQKAEWTAAKAADEEEQKKKDAPRQSEAGTKSTNNLNN